MPKRDEFVLRLFSNRIFPSILSAKLSQPHALSLMPQDFPGLVTSNRKVDRRRLNTDKFKTRWTNVPSEDKCFKGGDYRGRLHCQW